MNYLISVILPVYNGDKYLSDAIESILKQTYKNFELIIINDGSTDNSLNIIEKYKNKDKRIILINRENKGLVASLNQGIDKAKGEYIARMDADDICIVSRFEEQISYMKENNLDLCGSFIEQFNDKEILKTVKLPEKHNDIMFRSFFMSSFAHPSVMIAREVFDNLRYENDVAEDYRLWCDIISKGYKVGNIQKVLLKYRIHENQITQTKSKELRISANNIGLNFARNIDKKMGIIIEKVIDTQDNNNYNKFDEILQNIFIYAKKYNVNKNNLYFIISTLYNRSNPKNLIVYYLYYKVTRNFERDMGNEVNFFLRSLITSDRESNVYKLLKYIKNVLKSGS